MPAFLVSYDLKGGDPSPHSAFLTCAEPEGWLYVYKGKRVFRLPNTTLWGEFADAAAAVAAFDRALAAAERHLGRKVVLEKRIVTRFDPKAAKSDRIKDPDPALTGATDFETCRLHQLHDPFFA